MCDCLLHQYQGSSTNLRSDRSSARKGRSPACPLPAASGIRFPRRVRGMTMAMPVASRSSPPRQRGGGTRQKWRTAYESVLTWDVLESCRHEARAPLQFRDCGACSSYFVSDFSMMGAGPLRQLAGAKRDVRRICPWLGELPLAAWRAMVFHRRPDTGHLRVASLSPDPALAHSRAARGAIMTGGCGDLARAVAFSGPDRASAEGRRGSGGVPGGSRRHGEWAPRRGASGRPGPGPVRRARAAGDRSRWPGGLVAGGRGPVRRGRTRARFGGRGR